MEHPINPIDTSVNAPIDPTEHMLILGGCVAAKEAAAAIRKRNQACKITILSAESYLPYYRPLIPDCFNDQIREKSFYLATEQWYSDNNIQIYLQDPAVGFHPKHKKVKTQSGKEYIYDKILLAMGSYNFVPFENALQKKGVFTIKLYQDALNAKKYAEAAKKVVVIGGGLLGLEAAWELKQKGLQVTIIELMDRILPMQLDEEGSALLEDMIADKGLELVLGRSVQEIAGTDKVTAVVLDDQSVIPCDMVLFSVGIRPNIALVKESGLEINRGILVNERMETSLEDVYAAGDICEYQGQIYGLWQPAAEQAKIAGANMAGDSLTYKATSLSALLTAFDTRIFSAGDLGTRADLSYEVVVDTNTADFSFKKLYFANHTVVGGIYMQNIGKSVKLIKAIDNKMGKEEALQVL